MKMQVTHPELRQAASWDVPVHGHRWVGPGAPSADEDWVYDDVMSGDLLGSALEREACDRNPPWLISGATRFRNTAVRTYVLPDDALLHRILAATVPSPEAILGLVGEYGSLFGYNFLNGGVSLITPRCAGRPKAGGPFLGESLDRWSREIQHIRTAVRLWDLSGRNAQEPSTKDLERMFVAHEGSLSLRSPGMTEGTLEPLEDGSSRTHTVPSFDNLGQAAIRYVVQLINRNVGRAVSPRLRQVESARGLEWQTELGPRNLLGAAWLGLLQEVSGKRVIRQCPVCREWFDATFHPRQLYCHKRASGCRKRASRLGMNRRAHGVQQGPEFA